MKRLLMMLVVLLILSQASAWAQSGELFGGFSVLSVGGGGSRYNPLGWQAAVSGKANETWGVVGDFSGNYKDGGKTHFFLGGIQGSASRDKVTPFAHAMAGGVRGSGGGSSETNFALGFGGGFDYNTSDRIAIRVVQFDWLPVKEDSGWEKNVIRFGFGIVFKGSK